MNMLNWYDQRLNSQNNLIKALKIINTIKAIKANYAKECLAFIKN